MNLHKAAILTIALCVLIYWSRVMVMAMAARRRTGSAAQLVPRERLGRRLRLLWAPIVTLWITGPFLALASRPRFVVPLWRDPIAGSIAAIVAVLALVATFICWRTMGRQWRMGIDPAVRTKLVTAGPFSQVRHPIYALSMLLMLCTAVAIPSPLILAIAPLHIGLLYWEARREENYLHRVHGDRYDDYCRRTGRFLPRLRRAGSSTERDGACTSSA